MTPILDNCIRMLKDLVTVDTRQPEGNESVLVDFIQRLFAGYDVEMRRLEHGSNRSSLIVKLPGAELSGGVGFFSHLDTVAFGDESKWKYPPLSATTDGDLIYGRGTADMKGGAVASLQMALCLLEDKIPLKKPVYLCFTADEEAGGIGITSMLDDDWIKGLEEAVICEPTGERIGIGEKGCFWLRVRVSGVQAHGSRPEIAVNALDYAIRFIGEFRATIDSHTHNPLLGTATASLTKLNGGVMTNVIPAAAELELDIRTLPEHSHKELLENANRVAEALAASTPGLSFQLEVINNRAAVQTLPDDPFVRRMQAACDRAQMDSACRGLLFYTDASQLIPAIPMPFVILGPGDDKQAHQTDEHIDPCSVLRMARLYLDYVTSQYGPG